MANPEHLEILKQGVGIWNQWREKNPEIKPNLEGSDFSNKDFRGINFDDVNFSEAKFNACDLRDARFMEADLFSVFFRQTNLQNSNFEATYLWGATFKNVNLQSTILRFADLRNATFQNVVLTGANLNDTATGNWRISGIECDYVFFDLENRFRTPNDRNFKSGEFERLYKKNPTIEIEFSEGITLMGMAVLEHVIRKIREERPDLGLRFIAVDAKGLYPKARFEIGSIDQGDQVKDLISQGFQEIRQDQQRYAQITSQTILGELKGLGGDVLGQLRVIKQDVKALPGELKRHIDAATQKILNQAGIKNSEVMQLAKQIRSNETAIQKLSQLRDSDLNEIEDIKERLSWLKPYFEMVFNQKFDTTGTKVIRAVFKAVSTHFTGDFLGDQTNLKL